MTTIEHLPVDSVVERLRNAGLTSNYIAQSLGLPLTLVQQVNVDLHPNEALDTQLSEALNVLSLKAVKRAEYLIEYGPLDAQVQLIKPLLTALGRYVATQGADETGKLRDELTILLAKQRDIGELPPIDVDPIEPGDEDEP